MDPQKGLDFHRTGPGKVQIAPLVQFDSPEDLQLVYTPGMGYPCLEIAEDPEKAYEYTMKARTVAVVTDGTAVLGFGSIGAKAALPVMEGKCLVFKKFANVDAIPICLDTTDPDEIISIVKNIAPVFGGIQLEDIKAPECFYIEDRLKEILDIPVFHDDQHGTAVVCLAGLINALKVVDKKMEDCKIVINGAGAAGIAIAKILLQCGAVNVILADSRGAINSEREGLNDMKVSMLDVTNPNDEGSLLADIMVDCDVFLGVSKADLVTQDMVRSMADDPIVFAMANPDPEIKPPLALEAGAAVVATGRADYPNQVNNVLGFPGIFKALLEMRAGQMTDEMKVAAARGLAGLIENPTADKVIPGAFDEGVVDAVVEAMKGCA